MFQVELRGLPSGVFCGFFGTTWCEFLEYTWSGNKPAVTGHSGIDIQAISAPDRLDYFCPTIWAAKRALITKGKLQCEVAKTATRGGWKGGTWTLPHLVSWAELVDGKDLGRVESLAEDVNGSQLTAEHPVSIRRLRGTQETLIVALNFKKKGKKTHKKIKHLKHCEHGGGGASLCLGSIFYE